MIQGYITDCDTIVCPQCVSDEEKDELIPLFDEEWDYPLYCSDCNALMDVPLTKHGIEYVLEGIAISTYRPKKLYDILEIYGYDIIEYIKEHPASGLEAMKNITRIWMDSTMDPRTEWSDIIEEK